MMKCVFTRWEVFGFGIDVEMMAGHVRSQICVLLWVYMCVFCIFWEKLRLISYVNSWKLSIHSFFYFTVVGFHLLLVCVSNTQSFFLVEFLFFVLIWMSFWGMVTWQSQPVRRFCDIYHTVVLDFGPLRLGRIQKQWKQKQVIDKMSLVKKQDIFLFQNIQEIIKKSVIYSKPYTLCILYDSSKNGFICID